MARGSDKEAKADEGRTALHAAAAKGHVKAVKLLVAQARTRRRRRLVEQRRCTPRRNTGRQTL